MTAVTEIRRAGLGDATTIAELIAAAFHPLDIAHWLIGDDGTRARIFPAYFRMFVDHALTHGRVDIAGDLDGAALWVPVTQTPPAPEDFDVRMAAACGPHLSRFLALDAAFDSRHPASPHHHLALLAVRPDRQQRGVGTALLTHHHATLDADGIAAYLEASSARSRALYLRLGYHDLLGAPFYLANDGPPWWPMWRPPTTDSGKRR